MASRSRHEAQVRYSAETKQLVAEVRAAGRAQQQAIKGVEDAVRSQASGWRGLTAHLANVRQSYLLVRGVMSSVVGEFMRLVDSSAQQQSAIRQQTRALSLHGIAWRDATAEIARFEDQLTSTTRFGDEQTREVMTRIAQATAGMSLSLADLQRSATLALDIMEATGKSAQETAQILAKTWSGNFESVRELLPEVARELARLEEGSGNAAEALRRLEAAFGGAREQLSAQEQGLAEARNRWGDFKQVLGDVAGDALVSVTGGLTDVADALADATGAVRLNQTTWEQWFAMWTPERRADLERAAGLRAYVAAQEGYNPLTTGPGRDREGNQRLAGFMFANSPGFVEFLNQTGPRGAWASEPNTPENAQGPQRRGRSPLDAASRLGGGFGDVLDAALGAWSAAALDKQRDDFQEFLDFKREAYDTERSLEEARTAFLQSESQKRTGFLQAEADAERMRARVALESVGAVISSAQQIAAGSGQATKVLAQVKNFFMLGAAFEGLFFGDPKAPLAFTSALNYATSAGIALSGIFGGFGGGGGGRGRGRSYGPASASQAGALLQGPPRAAQSIVVNVTYGTYWGGDKDRTTAEVSRHAEEGIRRGLWSVGR